MKLFNYSDLHFAEVTFYKIHTLDLSFMLENFVNSTHTGRYYLPEMIWRVVKTCKAFEVFIFLWINQAYHVDNDLEYVIWRVFQKF